MDHMEDLSLLPGLPPALLDALRTQLEGGAFYEVGAAAPSPGADQLIPCFIVRSEATRARLAATRLELTTLGQFYEEEGPLTVFRLRLHEVSAPEVELMERLRGEIVSIQITPMAPLILECFLDPTEQEGRLMLQAMASSPEVCVEYYLTDPAMSYQATKKYPNAPEQQGAARRILERTQALRHDGEHFLAARQRYIDENPL